MWNLHSAGYGPTAGIQIANIIAERASEYPIQDWLTQSLEQELNQCVLFFRMRRDKLEEYKFIKRRDITHESLGMTGSYYDCDYLLMRFAEELLFNKRNG